ncbi:hypothetical protein EW146_g10201 [Bondarzewia mesenterica]|uniref:Protein-S-isoprenylcysteine O-methyltransferase n=1 Tax=Bondarzewia mesenterica TaxID=1095465 RepID=A0A4S4L1C7_9AGAM|nr:hypothetical protein EW146_g10201 [Bondarzewia mesenterica]
MSSTIQTPEPWLKLSLLLVAASAVHFSLSPPQPPVPPKRQTPNLFNRVVRHITLVTKSLTWMLVTIDALTTLSSSYPPLSNAVHLCGRSSPSSLATLRTPSSLFILGAASALAGALLRKWCYDTLGRLFTFEISIMPGHELVTSGPYAWVRTRATRAFISHCLASPQCSPRVDPGCASVLGEEGFGRGRAAQEDFWANLGGVCEASEVCVDSLGVLIWTCEVEDAAALKLRLYYAMAPIRVYDANTATFQSSAMMMWDYDQQLSQTHNIYSARMHRREPPPFVGVFGRSREPETGLQRPRQSGFQGTNSVAKQLTLTRFASEAISSLPYAYLHGRGPTKHLPIVSGKIYGGSVRGGIGVDF